MEPDLGKVKGVVGTFRRVLLRHHLNGQFPAGKVAPLDALEEVTLMAFPVLADNRLSLFIAQVTYPLLGDEVKLDPVPFVFCIDETEGVASEAVHMTVGIGNAPIAHNDSDLVQGLRQRGPEVPVVAGAAHVGIGVALDGMVEVWELERVAKEKYRRVVTHEIPVALFGIELGRKAPDVPLGVGSAALAGHRGKAGEGLGLLPHFGENLGPGIAGNVMGDREGPISAGTLGMHSALRDHLPIKLGELLQEPDILQQRRAARSSGHGVLVVDDGRSSVRGQLFWLFLFWFFHKNLLLI